jgi:predicted transcriptional regulator of viral defense system
MSTVPTASQIADIARGQHGLVTHAQLLELKIGRRQIEGWTSTGRLDRVLPGVLRVAGAPKTREQELLGAVLWGGTDSLASHRAAGELWGFDGIRAARPEITIPISTRKRSAEVVVHQTRSPLTQRRTRRGVPTTTPERTLIDLAGSLSPEQLEIAFESARRDRHVTTASVERARASRCTREARR